MMMIWVFCLSFDNNEYIPSPICKNFSMIPLHYGKDVDLEVMLIWITRVAELSKISDEIHDF